MEEIKVTPASEFRRMREKGVKLTLYSGRTIRMRNTDPGRLLPEIDKNTPEIFQKLILDLFWKGDYDKYVDEFMKQRESPQETAAVAFCAGIVARKVLMEPVIVDTPQTDDDAVEIALSDLHSDELAMIFRLAFLDQRVLYYLEANGLSAIDDKPSTEATPGE